MGGLLSTRASQASGVVEMQYSAHSLTGGTLTTPLTHPSLTHSLTHHSLTHSLHSLTHTLHLPSAAVADGRPPLYRLLLVVSILARSLHLPSPTSGLLSTSSFPSCLASRNRAPRASELLRRSHWHTDSLIPSAAVADGWPPLSLTSPFPSCLATRTRAPRASGSC